MMHSDNLDLSFSGLKTSVLYTVRDIENITDEIKADIAASFQQAVIDVLTRKIKKAVEASGRSDVIIAGGVAANKALLAATPPAIITSDLPLASTAFLILRVKTSITAC